MGTIVVVLLFALALSAAVMLYAAYPYRGEDTPLTPRLGQAMRRGVGSLPTLDREEQDRVLVASWADTGTPVGESPDADPHR